MGYNKLRTKLKDLQKSKDDLIYNFSQEEGKADFHILAILNNYLNSSQLAV